MRARRAASQEGRHGDRWERRRLWASTALNDYLDWPGLAQVCCVERTRRHTDQEAQGQRDGRMGLCQHQPAAGAGGCCPVAARLLPGLLPGCWRSGVGTGGLKTGCPAALGAGRGVRRGPEPGANGVGAATAGGTAEPGENLVIGMFRLNGVRNIAAALRYYGWKPWETLALIGLLPNN